jgi:hypothetical protein
MALCELAPVVLTGANVALKVGCPGQMLEVPITNLSVKKTVNKTEVTASTSYFNGAIWQEYAPGSLGGGIDGTSQWRISAAVQPPAMRVGAIYRFEAYVRRPGVLGPGDLGSAYFLNGLVDSSDLTLDPKVGNLEWKFAATATGPIIDPT